MSVCFVWPCGTGGVVLRARGQVTAPRERCETPPGFLRTVRTGSSRGRIPASLIDAASGTTLWRYLDRTKVQECLGHLPILRVLDIIGWMHARSSPGADA